MLKETILFKAGLDLAVLGKQLYLLFAALLVHRALKIITGMGRIPIFNYALEKSV